MLRNYDSRQPTWKDTRSSVTSPIKKNNKIVNSQNESLRKNDVLVDANKIPPPTKIPRNYDSRQPTGKDTTGKVPSAIKEEQKRVNSQSESLRDNASDTVLLDVNESSLL